MLCQKLGGSLEPSPKRPPLKKASSQKLISNKPAAAPARSGNRKGLARTITDDKSANPKRIPSLSRAATEPMLTHLKREGSEISLTSIPTSKTTTMKRYSQREVDLQAQSKSAEARLKKKAEIDQETQDAIAALRKPNRDMTAKPYADAVYKRERVPQPKKPKPPARDPLAPLVLATPRKENKVVSFHQSFPLLSDGVLHDVEATPSTALKVPCSTYKPNERSKPAPSMHFMGASRLNVDVKHTPTRGESKFRNQPASPSTASNQAIKVSLPSGRSSGGNGGQCTADVRSQLPLNSAVLLETPTKVQPRSPFPQNSTFDSEATPPEA